MGENEVKEDEYEIERKNPEKRKKIIKIYILLFFGAWGKLILTALLSKIEIIFEYANIIIAISGFIFIFILGAFCNRNDDFSYSFLIILYNITYISFFTSLKILEKKDKYNNNYWILLFISLIINYVVIFLFFFCFKIFKSLYSYFSFDIL